MNIRRKGRWLARSLVFLAVITFVVCSVTIASARSAVAQDYAALTAKTIRITTTGTPGGASDQLARIFADAVRAKVPGIVIAVQNLRAKGNVVAMKEVYESGAREVNLSLISAGILFQQLSKGKELPFDLSRMPAVGAFTSSYFLLGLRKGTNWDLHRPRSEQQQLKIGVHYRSASDYFFAILLNAVTNLNIKPVEGFETDVMKTTFLAGDFNAMIVSASENEATLIDSGDLKPLVLIGRSEYPEFVTTGVALSEITNPDASIEVVRTMQEIADFGRILIAAPNTDLETVGLMRQLFDEITARTDYEEAVEKAGLQSAPRPGKDVQRLFAELFNERSKLRSQISAAVECGQKIAEGHVGDCSP